MYTNICDTSPNCHGNITKYNEEDAQFAQRGDGKSSVGTLCQWRETAVNAAPQARAHVCARQWVYVCNLCHSLSSYTLPSLSWPGITPFDTLRKVVYHLLYKTAFVNVNLWWSQLTKMKPRLLLLVLLSVSLASQPITIVIYDYRL